MNPAEVVAIAGAVTSLVLAVYRLVVLLQSGQQGQNDSGGSGIVPSFAPLLSDPPATHSVEHFGETIHGV